MIDAAEQICSLCEGLSRDELEADRIRRDALLWNFTVLGEAATQVSEQLRAAHAEVEWRRPVELRHRIVHGYWSIDAGILVSTAHNDLPGFIETLQSVRAEVAGPRST